VADTFGYWMDRDLVAVTGPESEAYLQGQLSQDVAALGPGGHAWSWLLAPTGKVDALLRAARIGPEEWILDTDGGWGEAVAARLNRFKLRTKAEISARPGRVLAIRGDVPETPEGLFVAAPPWPGVDGADVVMAPDGAAPADLSLLDPADAEAERIAAGVPRMGAELDERTIPGETGLVPFTVNFDKGCYTGQELVARIDSRGGNVPRRLCRLQVAEGVAAGTEFADETGQAAGVVTSVAESGRRGRVGLGYLKRRFEPPVSFAGIDVLGFVG
jgi:folate-binding protein YgfZ